MKENEKTYPTETILKSKEFSGFQREFARVLLPKSTYTLQEARAILTKFFGGDR